MKSKLNQRLKRVLPSGPRRERGVAILTVLAIISLMTVLVISFFNMAQTQQTTAKGTVEIQRVSTLRDTILNLVIAQVRDATTLEGTNAQDFVVWASQPGAIRTFSGVDTSRNMVFKLYSSDQPQVSNIQPYDTSGVLSEIRKDLVTDWDIRFDEFVDINRPVFTVASGSQSIDRQINQDHFSYPIADPRRYNGQNDKENNTEGFDFSGEALGLTINGVNPKEQQLAMPVRWIYVLQDGTMGYLKSGQFTPLTGGNVTASLDNPIVGRMAWWTDDESSKINVNTASVPAVWDTPRTTSREDLLMANSQPLAGEFQRCPGHPATTDISAVLFPGRRFTPDKAIIPTGVEMNEMRKDDANLLWMLAPYIKHDDGGLGTYGGSRERVVGNGAIVYDNEDYIYTSFDEMYFRAMDSANNSNLDSPRSSLLKTDDRGQFLTRLEQSQFFLTHKSHSPETTMHGFPRISMYPMNEKAKGFVGSSGVPPTDVSPLDVALAVNSTIGKQAYFTQRVDQNSRHNEFYINAAGRNRQVFKYLKELSRLPIPGYPEVQAIKITQNPDHDDKTGLALASKYPAAYNNQDSGTKPFRDTKVKNTDNLILDASDRTQILFSMLDYTRTVNMKSGTITGTQYDGGKGQAVSYCGCSRDGGDVNADHTNLMSSRSAFPHTRTPRGYGRVGGVAEVAMVINVAASRTGNKNEGVTTTLADADPDSRALWNKENDSGKKFLVEVGFVASTFCPKIGWSPVFLQGGIAVSSGEEKTGADPRSPANPAWATYKTKPDIQLPFRVNNGDENIPLVVSAARRDSFSTNKAVINDLLPQGGLLGPRPLLNQAASVAMCRPFVIRATESTGNDAKINLVSESTQTTGNKKLRIHPFDGDNAAHNVIQQIELMVPADLTENLVVPMSSKSLADRTYVASLFNKGSVPANVFIKSWVVPHGDYRQVVAPLRIEKDIFVPHGSYKSSNQAYSFWEPNTDLNRRKYGNAQYSPLPSALMMDPTRVKGQSTADILAGKGPYLPPPYADLTQLAAAQVITKIDPKVSTSASASTDPVRGLIFQHGRLDGHGISPNRGSSDPTETGDFDQGPAETPDGPYLNATDDGDLRSGGNKGYFLKNGASSLTGLVTKYAAPAISPNFLIRSPVDFGSIPTGIQARVPWQTLRFRPDPGMNQKALIMNSVNAVPPRGMPYSNFCGPRDHFFLDMFWMPVVEPWSISEPFSTKGTINLNQQIYPFMYINRTTGLHALMRGERMLAIPNEASSKYKDPNNSDATYRYFINAKETVRQFTKRYMEGQDAEGQAMPFNAFRSASEICEIWLVPEKNGGPYESGQPWTMEYTHGIYNVSDGSTRGFWSEHLPTGDNSRERPYANLYPRVTTRSNVYKVHLVAQSLQKGKSTDPMNFDSMRDAVTGEWRGSAMIERSIDPRDSELSKLDYVKNLKAESISATTTPRVDRYYIYRVTEVKQLTE